MALNTEIMSDKHESKTCWCGICEHAAGGCPVDWEWRYCEKNYQIGQEQEK